jgi:hypothetical protein
MRSFERSSDFRKSATPFEEKEDSIADFTTPKACGSEIGSTGC